MKVSPFDAVLLCIALLIVIRVTFKGFIAEFFSVAAFLIAVFAAFRFYPSLTVHGGAFGLSPVAACIAAFFIIFIAVFLAVKCIQCCAEAIFNNEILGSLDHALGFFLGVFEACIVLCIIIELLSIQPFFDPEHLFESSAVIPLFTPFLPEKPLLLQEIRAL